QIDLIRCGGTGKEILMTKANCWWGILSLVFVSNLGSDPPRNLPPSNNGLSIHLASELDRIRFDPSKPEEGQYAARRALDLLVLFRIHNPSQWPSVLSQSNTVATLREFEQALPNDSDATTFGTIAALLGEYD